jgi:hypothetical protein
MDQKLASNIRKIALVVMIVFDVLMLIALWLTGQYVCFWMFVAINVIVGIAEVVNSLWVYKKTVSTQITKTLEEHKEKRLLVYVALICFLLSMVSLFVHWIVW